MVNEYRKMKKAYIGLTNTVALMRDEITDLKKIVVPVIKDNSRKKDPNAKKKEASK